MSQTDKIPINVNESDNGPLAKVKEKDLRSNNKVI